MKNNNNNNDKANQMIQPNGYKFRVYKFNKNTYDAFATFVTLQDAVSYMRRWNPNQMHNWYILDEDTSRRFEMNPTGDALRLV